jgi:hypothetical protein
MGHVKEIVRWGALAALVAFGGCPERRAAKDRLYFDDLKAPLGTKIEVVSDISLNPATGGAVTVIAVVEPDIDRDDLDRLLQTFWLQVSARSGFQSGTADQIDVRFYDSTPKAKAGGTNWLCQAVRVSRLEKPTFINRQRLPLLKWARKAMGKLPQYTGALQPELLADPVALHLELKLPFVSDDGSGSYVETLSYTKATTNFTSYAGVFFGKIEQLKKFTFVGVHNDEPVIRIWLTRDQFEQLNLRQVEESLGKFQGAFIEQLMSRPQDANMVEKKVEERRRKLYRETFSRLPEGQVELAKFLR